MLWFMKIFVVPLVVEFCIFRSDIVSLEIGIVVPFIIKIAKESKRSKP